MSVISQYMDGQALIDICFLVNFVKMNPSKIDLLPRNPVDTKFYENYLSRFRDSESIAHYVRKDRQNFM